VVIVFAAPSRRVLAVGRRRRSEVDHGQPAARLERLQQAGVHRRRIVEMMVDVPHEHRVAASLGEVRFLLPSFERRDVRESLFFRFLAQSLEAILVQLIAVDAARGTGGARQGKAEGPVAGADFANHASLPDLEDVDEPLGVGRVLFRVLRRGSSGDEEDRGGKVDESRDEPQATTVFCHAELDGGAPLPV